MLEKSTVGKEQTMSRLMIVEVPSYSCEFKGIREVRELVRCRECEYQDNQKNALCECSPVTMTSAHTEKERASKWQSEYMN